MADPNVIEEIRRGDIGRLIWRLSVPSIIGLASQAAFNLLNAYFVGNLGPASIAAVSIIYPLVLLFGALGIGVGIGAASLSTRRMGTGDREGVDRIVSTAVFTTLLLALALAAAGSLALDPILGALGASPTVLPLAREYARLIFVSNVFLLVNIVSGFVVRAEGKTRLSMWTQLGAFATNAALDALFIRGLGWGVGGAGWATLLSQVLATALYVHAFARGRTSQRVALRHFAPGFATYRQIAAIGLPATVSQLVIALAMSFAYRAAGAQGDVMVAGLGLFLRLQTLPILVIGGLCNGSQAILGINYGQRDRARVARALRLLAGYAVAVSALWSLAFVLLPRPLLAPFVDDGPTLTVAAHAARVLSLAFALYGLYPAVTVTLQSMGKAKEALVIAFSRHGPVLFLAVTIAGWVSARDGVLYGFVASEVVAVAVSAGFVLALLRALGRGEEPGPALAAAEPP